MISSPVNQGSFNTPGMTEFEKLQALGFAGEVITEKSKSVTIIVRPGNLIEKVLMKIGWMKTERVFEISPILVGNRLRVSALANKIPNNLFENGRISETKAWQAIQDYTDHFIYIVAVCIQNNKKEPSRHLLEYLRWIDDRQFFQLLDKSLSLAGIELFMKSIILIKGASVLNVPEKVAMTVTDRE